jgi:hypothetical protein
MGNRLGALRGRGESYAAVILRLVEQEGHMRAVAWLVSVGALLAPSMLPASGETLYCTDWQGIRTCTDAHGYVSHETQWQGQTNGWDNSGNRWTTPRWRDMRPPRSRSQSVEPRASLRARSGRKAASVFVIVSGFTLISSTSIHLPFAARRRSERASSWQRPRRGS